MTAPTIAPTAIAEIVEVIPVRHGDDRGWFSETWNRADLAAVGITTDWVQDNESLSAPRGTLRGIHFQTKPDAQDKLIRVLAGSIFDVAVDLRVNSPTFGHHVAVTLSADKGNQLLVPQGFGHAFCTLEDNCRVVYKVSTPYSPSADRSLRFDDPDLAIEWPIPRAELHLSTKDLAASSLDDLRRAGDLFRSDG